MDHKEVKNYILSMPNSWLDYPFGEEVAVYKVFVPSSGFRGDEAHGDGKQASKAQVAAVSEAEPPDDTAIRAKQQQVSGLADKQAGAAKGDWKMFALIAEGSNPVRLSLKCDPKLALLLREKYETVLPGYHLNKKHWNTIICSGQLSSQEVKDLILHSFNLVANLRV